MVKFIFGIGLLISVLGLVYIAVHQTNDLVIIKSTDYLTREKLNKYVELNKETYYKKFSNETNNFDISKVIIDMALKKKVPITLAFALSFVESRYNPKAINKNSHSIDRGLFQLNNRSFPKADFFDIEENSKYALAYLRELFDRYDSWTIAIMLYNAGSASNVSKSTLKYVAKVLKKENELNHLIIGDVMWQRLAEK